jgi:WD40 repeat protein
LERYRPKPGEHDLRGWEWRYLWQFCQSEAVALGRRPNSIISLSASPDGKWLAIAEMENGGLSVMNLQTRMETRLPSGSGGVRTMFSPQGSFLATTSEEGTNRTTRASTVLIWDIATWQVVKRLPLDGPCGGLFFSEDEQTLIATISDQEHGITRWRVSDGMKLGSYPAKLSGVTYSRAAVSRDFSVAAHATPDSLFRVVDLGTGHQRWEAKPAQEPIKALAISPDKKLIATGAGYSEGTIWLSDMASGKEVKRLEGHHSWVSSLAFWPDGKTLASASADQTIRIWDVSNGRLLRTLRGHTLEVWSLILLPDNRTLVSGSKDGSVLLWDLALPTANRGYSALPSRVAAWRFLPDSKSVLTLDHEGRIERWQGDAFQEKTVVTNVGKLDNPLCTTIARDVPLVAIGRNDGSITVWDWERRIETGKFHTIGRPPFPGAFLEEADCCRQNRHWIQLPRMEPNHCGENSLMVRPCEFHSRCFTRRTGTFRPG